MSTENIVKAYNMGVGNSLEKRQTQRGQWYFVYFIGSQYGFWIRSHRYWTESYITGAILIGYESYNVFPEGKWVKKGYQIIGPL